MRFTKRSVLLCDPISTRSTLLEGVVPICECGRNTAWRCLTNLTTPCACTRLCISRIATSAIGGSTGLYHTQTDKARTLTSIHSLIRTFVLLFQRFIHTDNRSTKNLKHRVLHSLISFLTCVTGQTTIVVEFLADYTVVISAFVIDEGLQLTTFTGLTIAEIGLIHSLGYETVKGEF
jgi:hypothetical protein